MTFSSSFDLTSRFQKTRDSRTWFILAATGAVGAAAGLLYAIILALPLFTSQATVVVRGGAMESQGGGSGLSLLRRGSGGADALGLLDGTLVQDYLRSPDAMAVLDQRVGLFRAFPNGSADPAHPLPINPSNEAKLKFYRSIVSARFSLTRQVVDIDASGRTPAEAQRLARGVVLVSEEFINRYNARVRRDFVTTAEQELATAAQKLATAQANLATLRNATGRLDPAAEATMIGSIIQQLEIQRVGVAAEVEAMQKLGGPDSPRLQRLSAELSQLDRSIEAQRARLVGSASAVSTSLAAFETATAELEFAVQSVEEARKEVSLAKANYARQHKYLLTVASPSEPSRRSWPRTPSAILIGALVGLFLGAISMLLLRAFPVR
jgi:capsular polysaccharide transport system permease protein